MKKYFMAILILMIAFTASSQKPNMRAHHALAYDEKNKIIIMTAGSTPVDGGNSGIFFNDNWSFDGKQWKLLGNSGDKRSGMGLAYDSKKQKLYSFGGFSDQGALSDLRLWEAGEWKTISRLPEMRAAEPGVVYDESRDKIIVFGGSVERGKVNADTWEWDGLSWKKFEGNGPAGRQAFVMVYDSKRKRTVLYGGMDGNGKPFDDGVWEFDGTTWQNFPNDGAGPGTRTSPGSAYDSKRGLVIIFSGRLGDGAKSDTWSWDGRQWKQLSEKGPAPRAMGYMAYDKERDRIVLFGGRLGWPNDAGDTWEWDGKEWKEIK